jgi:hypothetical protein
MSSLRSGSNDEDAAKNRPTTIALIGQISPLQLTWAIGVSVVSLISLIGSSFIHVTSKEVYCWLCGQQRWAK